MTDASKSGQVSESDIVIELQISVGEREFSAFVKSLQECDEGDQRVLSLPPGTSDTFMRVKRVKRLKK